MSELIQPRTLSGFMELLPKDQTLFDEIKQYMEQVYTKYGFSAIDTPVLEDSRVLLAKAGGETEKQIYRFSKGDTDLTMRFDLTVPLAKYVAKNYASLTFPFRRYQIGKVYRGERAQKGRFREFYQADIDIIGDGSLSIVNDAEIPSIIYELFSGLGLKNFVIRINNRKVLNGLFRVLELSEKSADVMRTIDKLDKIGREKVFDLLVELGVSESAGHHLLDILTSNGSKAEMIEKLEQYRGMNEVLDAGIDELKTVVGYIGSFGVPDDAFAIDLTIARGLDYYTGTVYETFIRSHPEYGSICSGGRYDNLAGYYTAKQLPGVGISIGLTRLFSVLNEQGFINGGNSSFVDVVVLPMTDSFDEAAKAAAVFRENGIRTQVYFEKAKFKKKIGYVDKLGAPYAVIIGTDEIEGGTVSLKDMTTGHQESCTAQEAAERVLDAIGKKKQEALISMD